MGVEYNKKKLTDTDVMKDKKVLIVGGGAVGSMEGEMLTRNRTGLISVVDKDRYESANLPKSSAIIRFPEDIGMSKAFALADRLNDVSDDGCKAVGNHLDVKRIGPMALVNFDYIVLALDNNAMKIHTATQIAQCPEDKRPIYLSGGTNKEFSEAMLFAPNGACLRCTIPDEWLKSEDPDMVFSCAAKVNLLLPTKQQEIVSTSGIASMKCAIDMDDMILAHASGTHDFSESMRYMQHAFPAKQGHSTIIMKHRSCPVCAVKPPEDVTVLPGCSVDITLREMLDMVSKHFDGEFRLKVHRLIIPSVNITQCYQDFILSAKCGSCGESFPVMKHSGLIRKDEITCPHCDSMDVTVEGDEAELTVNAFDYRSPENLMDMTLFDLGYPIGAYIEAEEVIPDDLTEEVDFLSEEISLKLPESKFFSLKGDETYLHETHGHNLLEYIFSENYYPETDTFKLKEKEIVIDTNDSIPPNDGPIEIEVVNTLNDARISCKVFPEDSLLELMMICDPIFEPETDGSCYNFMYDDKIYRDLSMSFKEFGIANGDSIYLVPVPV